MSKIRKTNGEKFVNAILIKLLNELCIFTPAEINGNLKVLFAETLLNSFWFLKIDDFVLCFRNAINGKYGKVFGKLTYIQIAEWLNAYITEKTSHYENDNLKNKEFGDRTDESEIKDFEKYYLK